MPQSGPDFLEVVDALPDITRGEGPTYTSFSVGGRKFGYYWPRTQTVGLKQTLSEQLALVAERPDVFEVQFTSGGFGWVVVTLAGVDRAELTELVFEAWRLTAPEDLLTLAPDPAGR
ncbi:MmcQ/YjbR family DNA-binding protein [Actinokineospora inagensis]|uniref:MmcQ/YjbR family DNA-binding protein n=1 Tax=Actinokineospora inagensis TaxID=103730 RepID=UPI0003F5BBD6|nr:MmcQ/YjbR family DNA-binding protein [Actinokineospora inagensis]